MRRATPFLVLVAILAVCSVAGWWTQKPVVLDSLSWYEYPFKYQLNGSGRYEASLFCVMATPAPGEARSVGCQHLEGTVSESEMTAISAAVSATNLTPAPANGRVETLSVTVSGKSFAAESPDLKITLRKLQPGKIEAELYRKRKAEERALKR